MKLKNCGIGIIAIAALGAAVCPQAARAQDGPGSAASAGQNDPINKKIDLDLESTNLYYGLKLLFSQVKANFTIDESLKSLTVTAHLTQVPFRVALETLLKSTSTPLTYKVENGIYSVVPKVESADPILDQNVIVDNGLKTGGFKFGMIRPNNVSAIDIVQAFGGTIVTVGYKPGSFGQGGLSGGIGGGLGSGLSGGLGNGQSGGNGLGGNGNSGGLSGGNSGSRGGFNGGNNSGGSIGGGF